MKDTSENVPRATHQGILRIMDIEIPCFVLDSGERVISGRGVTAAIGMKGRGQGVTRITSHSTLKQYINEDLATAILNPRYFIGTGSRRSKPTPAYEATMLLSLCDAILEARDEGQLLTDQEKRYARAADALTRAFAKVGIIALVDEATGYQVDREQEELQKLLSLYVAQELLPWAKVFPDEFYAEIFRLKGWKWKSVGGRRPRYVGKLTNEIVYDKLPRPVVEELRAKTPVMEDGRRRGRLQQWLTIDFGQPTLKAHLIGVLSLMRASPNWTVFKRLFERAYPTPGVDQQGEIFDDEV